MERGKTIWVNAFLNMVRLKITPEIELAKEEFNALYFDSRMASKTSENHQS